MLNSELTLKDRDIRHLSQHVTELKDLLQNTVKEKASFGSRSHREGELIIIIMVNYRVCLGVGVMFVNCTGQLIIKW